MADDYLDAARRKLAIARRFMRELDSLRGGDESEREEIQLNFEGVIASGSSAADQLAGAIDLKLALRLRNATPKRVLSAIDKEQRDVRECADCLELLRDWTREPIVVDAHRRRNRAVHHYYEKRPYRTELTWLLDAVQVDGKPSPYHGPLDVHSYCANYIGSLAKLEEATQCVEAIS
jgi:hypothetical protein